MIEKIYHFPLEKKEVISLLREHGITPTRQRLEIALSLFQKQQHLSAERILDNVNLLGHQVSRATVYNDSNSHPHHHIYKVDTGELSDVEGSSDMNLTNIQGLPEGCRIIDTDVVIKVSQR